MAYARVSYDREVKLRTHLVIDKTDAASLQKHGRLPLCLHLEYGVQVELTVRILAHRWILAQNHEIARNNRRELSIRNFGRQCLDLHDGFGVGDGIFVVPVVINETARYLDESAGSLDDACEQK